MALGQYGTTLLDELNRLANGGTYRAPSEMVDQALAARQWAVQRSVTTNLTDTAVLTLNCYSQVYKHKKTPAQEGGRAGAKNSLASFFWTGDPNFFGWVHRVLVV